MTASRDRYGNGCSSDQYDLDLLAILFMQAWPLDETAEFNILVQAIDRTSAQKEMAASSCRRDEGRHLN